MANNINKFLDKAGLTRLVGWIKSALNGKQDTISSSNKILADYVELNYGDTVQDGIDTLFSSKQDKLTGNSSQFVKGDGSLDSNTYLTSYTETDPTVPSWAKQSIKPSYDYSEINNTPTLATVATSGSYNDLSNKPTIPTVNNAALTIQKNGTNVATFTANASTGATANIIVPTATSDLTNDSGFLEDADVSYDADTKTLIIGGSSMPTVTLQGNAVGQLNSITINLNTNPEYVTYNDFPIEVKNGTRLDFEGSGKLQLQIIMGGVDVTSDGTIVHYEWEPVGKAGWGTTCSIYEITGDTVITVN